MTRAAAGRQAALLAVAAAALAALVFPSCAGEMSRARTAPGSPESASEPWAPPPEWEGGAPGAPPGSGASASGPSGAAPLPAIPPDLLAAAAHFTLADLVDVALRTNPQTRVTWASARSAAAAVGVKEATYYPTVLGEINGTRQKGSAVGGQFTFYATSYNPFVQLNWLLFDFGGRRATVDSARDALAAADWTHNQAIQDVVLAVEQAFYQYLDARALDQAERAAVGEAEASLDAAERRREAGLSTVADVLQAKTVLSQARLAFLTVEGQVQTVRGALATAVGLPANTAFDVDIPIPEVPKDQVAAEVERAITEAQARRPDLLAARAQVEKSEADLRAAQAVDRPSLNLSANGGRIYYNGFDTYQDTYAGSLLVTIPIFNGLGYQYNVHQARANRDAAQARLDLLSQQVTLEVWSSYFGHKTAAQQVETAADLLSSATQSYDVATGRYKAGVGSILDLLTAQSALESARAQDARARTDWFLTLAQLAHDTGALWRSTPEAAPGAAPEPAPRPAPGPAPGSAPAPKGTP